MICGLVERPWSTERRGISPREAYLTDLDIYDNIDLRSVFGGRKDDQSA